MAKKKKYCCGVYLPLQAGMNESVDSSTKSAWTHTFRVLDLFRSQELYYHWSKLHLLCLLCMGFPTDWKVFFFFFACLWVFLLSPLVPSHFNTETDTNVKCMDKIRISPFTQSVKSTIKFSTAEFIHLVPLFMCLTPVIMHKLLMQLRCN